MIGNKKTLKQTDLKAPQSKPEFIKKIPKNYGGLLKNHGGILIKKSTKKGGIYRPVISDLTPVEHDILHLIVDERLTAKQIQIRRNCKKSVVYKHLANLKKKGFLNIALQKPPFRQTNSMVESYRPTTHKNNIKIPPFQQSPTKGIPTIRLHGQEFRIKILFQH